MDKLKSVLAPGHSKDAETLYDTPNRDANIDSTPEAKKDKIGGLRQILNPKSHKSDTTSSEREGMTTTGDEAISAPAVQSHGESRPMEESYHSRPQDGLVASTTAASTEHAGRNAPSHQTAISSDYTRDPADIPHAIGNTPALAVDEGYPHEPSYTREAVQPVDHSTTSAAREHHNSHHGTTAAAGAGIGAAAVAHHEHEKHEAEQTNGRRTSVGGSGIEHADTLHTKPKKEHNILRAIFNPKNEKHDSTLYGSTASTDPAEIPPEQQKEHGVLRQLINPNEDRVDGMRRSSVGGATASEVLPSVTPSDKLETTPEAKKKEHGILRQIFNPHDDKVDSTRFGTTAHPQRNEANEVTASTFPPERERASANGVGNAAMGSSSHHREHKKLQKKKSRSPRNSGDIAPAIATQDHAHEHLTAVARPGTITNTPSDMSHSTGAGDASVASVASIKSGVIGNPQSKSTGHAQDDLPNIESTGGRFMDTRELSAPSNEPSQQHPKVTDALIAGGAAVGAGSMYVHHDQSRNPHASQEQKTASSTVNAVTHHRDQTATQPNQVSPVAPTHVKDVDTGPAKRTIGPHKSDILNILDPRVKPDPSKQKKSKTAEAKAATGPAQHTTGPHQSDVLNVIDPRVQPQWGEMKPNKTKEEHVATGPAPHTIGPHQSDTLNIIDPRVQPEPEKMKAKSNIAVVHGASGPTEHATATATSANETPKTYSGDSGTPVVKPQQDGSTAASLGATRSHGLSEHKNATETPDRKGGIIHGEHGNEGDVSNPYSATPLDQRLMPGAYPPTPSGR